jgi:hypothetical protein
LQSLFRSLQGPPERPSESECLDAGHSPQSLTNRQPRPWVTAGGFFARPPGARYLHISSATTLRSNRPRVFDFNPAGTYSKNFSTSRSCKVVNARQTEAACVHLISYPTQMPEGSYHWWRRDCRRRYCRCRWCRWLWCGRSWRLGSLSLVGDVGYQRDVSAKALQRAMNLVDDNGPIVNCFGARFLSLAPERASLGRSFFFCRRRKSV